MSLVEVRNLSISFKQDKEIIEAVKNISFDINKNEILALVGESGAGKSVTAYSILQLLPYPQASHPSGSIRFEGKEIIGSSNQFMQTLRGDRISMIFQEPMTSLNALHTIEKQICETLILHKLMSNNNARNKAVELLQLVNLHNPEKRLKSYPHELSGGERQRVMIAMALANEPDLLIADEPTTALDVTIQAQILDLLINLRDKTGMALLLITHDLTIVRKMADRICIMTQGEIVEQGTVKNIFNNPNHPYTIKLLNAEPHGSPTEKTIDYNDEILRAENIKVFFPLKKSLLKNKRTFIKAVDDISVTLYKGQTIGLVGESGSGKTTLGMAILRLIKSTGQIVFLNENIDKKKYKYLRPLRKNMQIIFQDPFSSLNPRLTIGLIISEGLDVHNIGMTKLEKQQLIAQTLTEVGLEEDIINRYPHEFSGGQRQRISIARALVLKPQLIILDEPTSALDLSIQAQIIDLLHNLQEKYKLTYLFISHDLRVIKALSHYIVVIKNGKIVEQGKAKSVFTQPQTDYTKSLISAALNIN